MIFGCKCDIYITLQKTKSILSYLHLKPVTLSISTPTTKIVPNKPKAYSTATSPAIHSSGDSFMNDSVLLNKWLSQ